MINGNEYSWEDVQIVLPGSASPIDAAAAIEYATKKDHTNVYGRSDKPVAMGRGKKEYSGSITLLQSGIEALQRTLKKGQDLTDIKPFVITVAYAPEDGGIITVDQLYFVRITEVPKGMKTGDPNMEVVLPLAIGGIEYNV